MAEQLSTQTVTFLVPTIGFHGESLWRCVFGQVTGKQEVTVVNSRLHSSTLEQRLNEWNSHISTTIQQSAACTSRSAGQVLPPRGRK
jgi:hypothetical protein